MDDPVINILEKLGHSSFRSRFRLSGKERHYAADKGLATIRQHALDFIRRRLAPAFPVNDGRQTPMKNHPVFIAQHATATCCRKCLEKWHGIRKGRALTEQEINYMADVIMQWIRLDLQAAPEGRADPEQKDINDAH